MRALIIVILSGLFSANISHAQYELDTMIVGGSLTRLPSGLKKLKSYTMADSIGYVIYNEDNSWMHTINYQGIPQFQNHYVFLISQYLFDLDDGVEYLLRDTESGESSVYIIDDDNTVIQHFEDRYYSSQDPCGPVSPIINDIEGSLMRLSSPSGLTSWYYELPGKIYCCHCDETVQVPAMGCTYPDADNYDPLAEQDDQTCIFDSCLGDFNNNQIVDTLDLLEFLGIFGMICD